MARTHSSRHNGHRDILRAGLLAVATLAFVGIPCVAVGQEGQFWRIPGNGAVNTLYMFLRISGYDATYTEFLSNLGPSRHDPSITTLREIADRLGYKSKVVKISLADIQSQTVPKPAILFSSDHTTTAGSWQLLLYANTNHVAVLTGETMIIRLIPIDDFRLEWTGYALVTQPVQPLFLVAARCVSFGFAMLAVASMLIVKIRKARTLKSQKLIGSGIQ